ncbi:MAG: nickel pincer cofactor biosynthesis protein LarC [Acidobacteriota bacterium]|nr:nickel pincer cofactor biosynthesis protein LarC [Acidobacteriota bacterium]
MRACYLDAFSGISGDMTVGALIDAGADFAELSRALESLNTGARFRVEKTKRRGIAASKFQVEGGETKSHRHLSHILELIERSALPANAKENSKAIFRRLGDAEAKVHDMPLEKVHFHEVGAVDSICDIVGACVGFDLLGITEFFGGPVNVGSGTVKTEHGVLPVPAPATTELLKGVPVYARGPAMELTTPTGAAIASTLVSRFGPMPAMVISATGHGAGDREFPEHANVLRIIVGERSGASEATAVSVLEANIDDSSPQVLGYAMERLLEAGALDVTLEPVFMKKNRPGTLLRVIAKPEHREMLATMIFAETTTLGLRTYEAERRVKARAIQEIETSYGKVRIKTSEDGWFAPEYEDCRKLAMDRGVPLKQVLADANLAYALANTKITDEILPNHSDLLR